MNEKCTFCHVIFIYLKTIEIYISLINSYLAFCFFFSMTTLLQLVVYRQELLNNEETKFSRIEKKKVHAMRGTVEKSY